MRPVECRTFTYFIKYRHWHAMRIACRLYYYWGNRTYQHRFSHPVFPIFCSVMNNFTTTFRVAEMYSIFQIKRLGKLGHVCCIGIHIMSAGSLGRSSVSAAVKAITVNRAPGKTSSARPSHRRIRASHDEKRVGCPVP